MMFYVIICLVMNMEKELPKRKSTRLKNFDYSTVGAYFVTICISDRKQILSEIIKTNSTDTDKTTYLAVENGVHNSPNNICITNNNPVSETNDTAVGEGLAPPVYKTQLKPCGKIVQEQLLLLEKRFSNVMVEDYIIMPDHIHAVIFIHKKAGGASPSPTLDGIVCAFKSLTSRICKQQYGIEKMFQRSFVEHIVRDKTDYETRRKYIYENPMRWYYRCLNTEEHLIKRD